MEKWWVDGLDVGIHKDSPKLQKPKATDPLNLSKGIPRTRIGDFTWILNALKDNK